MGILQMLYGDMSDPGDRETRCRRHSCRSDSVSKDATHRWMPGPEGCTVSSFARAWEGS